MCVSYWEQFGGGQDMWSSLWYPSKSPRWPNSRGGWGSTPRPSDTSPCEKQRTRPFAAFGRESIENGRWSIVTWQPLIGMVSRMIADMRVTILRPSPRPCFRVRIAADIGLARRRSVQSGWRRNLARRHILSLADRTAVPHREQPRLAGTGWHGGWFSVRIGLDRRNAAVGFDRDLGRIANPGHRQCLAARQRF